MENCSRFIDSAAGIKRNIHGRAVEIDCGSNITMTADMLFPPSINQKVLLGIGSKHVSTGTISDTREGQGQGRSRRNGETVGRMED